MSKDVADLVAQACSLKFSEPEIPSAPLTPDQMKSLSGRAGLSYGSTYSVALYNALDHITITEVEIYVATSISKAPTENTYRNSVTIPPKSTGNFTFPILIGDQGASYEWGIRSAKGRASTR